MKKVHFFNCIVGWPSSHETDFSCSLLVLLFLFSASAVALTLDADQQIMNKIHTVTFCRELQLKSRRTPCVGTSKTEEVTKAESIFHHTSSVRITDDRRTDDSGTTENVEYRYKKEYITS